MAGETREICWPSGKPALGFLSGSNCPHYDSEELRRPTYQQAIARGDLLRGFVVEDGVALHFIGTEIEKAVSVSNDKRAFYVHSLNGRLVEKEIVPECIAGL